MELTFEALASNLLSGSLDKRKENEWSDTLVQLRLTFPTRTGAVVAMTTMRSTAGGLSRFCQPVVLSEDPTDTPSESK